MGVSVDLINAEIEIGGPVASQWAGLASTIVFGLSFATILTLVVTPAMLALPERLRSLFKRNFRGISFGAKLAAKSLQSR